MEDIRTWTLRSIQKAGRIITHMELVDKSLSKQSMEKIVKPMGKMDWIKKDKCAQKLITILETSKDEKEILMRAKQARNFVIRGVVHLN